MNRHLPPALLEAIRRHEDNLNTHMKLCKMARKHMLSTGPTEAISAIISATAKLMNDMRMIQNDTSPSNWNGDGEHLQSDTNDTHSNATNFDHSCDLPNTPNNHTNGKDSTSGTNSRQSNSGQKRSRNEVQFEESIVTSMVPHAKRHRTDSGPQRTYNTATESSSYVPVIDVEDISGEVEARLKLKEEARRNRMGKKEKKRKRDNLDDSSEASTSIDVMPKYKRHKTSGNLGYDPTNQDDRGRRTAQPRKRVMGLAPRSRR